MEENKVITADDVTDIVLKQAGYYWESGYNEFDFTCKIKGEENQIHMTEYRYDEGSGVTIHSDKDDIWSKLPRREVYKLDDKIQDAIQYGQYHKKIQSAKNMEDIDDIRFELMEDNNCHLNHVIKKLWTEVEKKMESFEKSSVREKLKDKKKEILEKDRAIKPDKAKNKQNNLVH